MDVFNFPHLPAKNIQLSLLVEELKSFINLEFWSILSFRPHQSSIYEHQSKMFPKPPSPRDRVER